MDNYIRVYQDVIDKTFCENLIKKFERLKGMIIGAMSNMQDNDIAFGKTAYEIILSHISEYNFPVCFGFPAGHLKDNRAIKLGCPSFFEVNENDVILLQ